VYKPLDVNGWKRKVVNNGMKRFFSFSLGILASLVNTQGQLTLEAGDSYAQTIIFRGPSGLGGSFMAGHVCATFDPATVQPEDVVLLELFENDVGGLPLSAQAFTNDFEVCVGGTPFAWWDLNGSFRITMLSGTATLRSIWAFVSVGPFFGPFNFYEARIAPGPALKIVRLGNSQVQVSWSTNSAGLVLQASTTLRTNDWLEVTAPITTVGERFVVTLSGDKGFFRLQKP
jgi:hypothetical protein